VLDTTRAARLVEQKALHPELPGLDDVIAGLVDATFKAQTASPYEAEIARATQRVLVEQLMTLATGSPMSQVRAVASQALRTRMSAMSALTALAGDRGAHASLIAADIKRFLERPAAPATRTDTPDAPPGAPIGEPAMEFIKRMGWEWECDVNDDRF
jgi:hypothetical protein